MGFEPNLPIGGCSTGDTTLDVSELYNAIPVGNFTTSSVDVKGLDNIAFVMQWTGGASFFSIQAEGSFDDSVWVPLIDTLILIDSTTPIDAIELLPTPYYYHRLNVTLVSGTGSTLRVTVGGKKI